MELPRYHRLRSTFYRLQASRCAACQATYFPPRPYCLHCGSRNLEELRLSGRGRVLSLTRVYQPSRGFSDGVGTLTALIELPEGLRLIAQLTDVEPAEVETGQEVEMVVRRLRTDEEQGLIVYGYKFRPVVGARAAEGANSA
ncbi:Zn-ribbon domain-containing OB-fold protein [Acidobacteriia bacterium AH_259_A11_L15]|nr:Zn-ribbon domain-containing OB-fold protein [Acidobacteriia bacterium AH_259_A11_L15]